MHYELWLIIIAIALVIGAILEAPWVIFSSTVFLFILIISYFWKKFVLRGIDYERNFVYSRGFPGETIEMNFQIANESLLPISWIYFEDHWPTTLLPLEENSVFPTHTEKLNHLVHAASLGSRQKITRTMKFKLQRRGIYKLGPVDIYSGDFLGLGQTTRTLEVFNYLTIFPEVHPLEYFGFQTEDPFGITKADKRIFEDPIQTIGIRDYHPEDEMRKIHWVASARKSQLQVKVHQAVSEKSVVICMNSSTNTRFWEGTNLNQLEYNIQLSASICYELFQKGYKVGLLSNSSQAFSDQPIRVMPGKSPQQLTHILKSLAASTQFITAPFEVFLLSNAGRIPFGSTLIVISSNLSDQLQEVFIRIRQYRFNTTLILTQEEASAERIPGIQILILPPKNGDHVSN